MAQIKTAVEWYQERISSLIRQKENKEITIGEYSMKYFELFSKAKKMEKEQIVDSWDTSNNLGMTPMVDGLCPNMGDAYYAIKFK